MLFALILIGLVLVLLTGVPVFAGLMLFATAMLYAAEGHLGGIGDLVFGHLDSYLLVAIPLFTLMAHFMIRGKVVDDLFGAAHTLLRHLPGAALPIKAVIVPRLGVVRVLIEQRKAQARHLDGAVGGACGCLCSGQHPRGCSGSRASAGDTGSGNRRADGTRCLSTSRSMNESCGCWRASML